jgi:hypothetical protein
MFRAGISEAECTLTSGDTIVPVSSNVAMHAVVLPMQGAGTNLPMEPLALGASGVYSPPMEPTARAISTGMTSMFAISITGIAIATTRSAGRGVSR